MAHSQVSSCVDMCHQQSLWITLHTLPVLFDPPPLLSLQIRYFTLHSTKYFWNDELQNFEVLK